MVIAHVIDSLEIGGAEAVVAALCRLQSAAGHSVAVHCLIRGGALADGLIRQGIPVFVHGPARSLTVAWRLQRAFRRTRVEVVHCHNKSATVHAAPAGRLAGARIVVSTRHGMAAPPYRLRKELKFWVTAVTCCDRVVAVCETARRNMVAGAGRAGRNVVTIRNGAYPAGTGDGADIPKRGFTVISVGRLAPAKNYQTLIHSVAAAQPRVPDLALWLVGDGPDRASLTHLAAELGVNVVFAGERADVGKWLRQADIFVLSSLSEGLPISLLEALSAGLPAIVTEVGGMPEIVTLCGAGRTVPPGDVDRLADAIVDFAGRREELAALGRQASCCYRRYFTPERMADEYMSLYQAGGRMRRA